MNGPPLNTDHVNIDEINDSVLNYLKYTCAMEIKNCFIANKKFDWTPLIGCDTNIIIKTLKNQLTLVVK